MQNLTEEQGDTLLVGRRQLTSSGHVLYHVGVSARNATARFAGHYQCVVERQFDRLFALSTVAVAGRAAPLPQTPQLELNTCRHNTYNRYKRPVFHRLPEPNRAWLLVVYFSL